MVSFRPHKLYLLERGKGHYAENGDWIDSEEKVVAVVPCRYEPNGKANEINLPDGKAYRYAYTIYLDVNPCLKIEYGDIIRIQSQDGRVMGTYEVKGFHRGQLDMKVWV